MTPRTALTLEGRVEISSGVMIIIDTAFLTKDLGAVFKRWDKAKERLSARFDKRCNELYEKFPPGPRTKEQRAIDKERERQMALLDQERETFMMQHLLQEGSSVYVEIPSEESNVFRANYPVVQTQEGTRLIFRPPFPINELELNHGELPGMTIGVVRTKDYRVTPKPQKYKGVATGQLIWEEEDKEIDSIDVFMIRDAAHVGVHRNAEPQHYWRQPIPNGVYTCRFIANNHALAIERSN